MKVAAIQLNSVANKSKNLAKIKHYINLIGSKEKPDLIALPEMFTFMGGSLQEKKANAEITSEPFGETLTLLQQLAKKYKVFIHAGSFCEIKEGKFYNTSCIINHEGKLIATYRKMKLFRYASQNDVQYDESTWLIAGKELTTYACDNFTVGCAICFDIRFGDLFQKLIKKKISLLIVPSAFTYETGKAHWEILCRSRAIETQSYLIAPAQTGSFVENGIEKTTWGHSIIVDPWGEIISSLGAEEGYLTATLDLNYLKKIRDRLPVVNQGL